MNTTNIQLFRESAEGIAFKKYVRDLRI